MSKRMFSQDQIEGMLKNRNVLRCSPKSIVYDPAFKADAVRLYYDEGYSPGRIFTEAGFDLRVIGRKTPKDCLNRWRRKYRRQGLGGLLKDGRTESRKIGRPKKSGLSDRERIEYLEAKVAYLKAENDFLTKLRAANGE